MLEGLPRETLIDKRDRALVQFLISTGCRISEALNLDRTDVPRQGTRLIVTGKGSKQRPVFLTSDAKLAIEEYLQGRTDTSMALFVNYDRSIRDDKDRRLTQAGARHIVSRIRRELGAWSFKSPHVARHTTATTLLEVTGGDVRLVQEVLGHANLNTLQGYTKTRRLAKAGRLPALPGVPRHPETLSLKRDRTPVRAGEADSGDYCGRDGRAARPTALSRRAPLVGRQELATDRLPRRAATSACRTRCTARCRAGRNVQRRLAATGAVRPARSGASTANRAGPPRRPLA